MKTARRLTPAARRGPRELRAGFSLIELMVVGMVLAAMSVVVGSSLDTFLPKQRLGTAVRSLTEELRELRSEAISRSLEYYIEYDIDGNRYRRLTPFALEGGVFDEEDSNDERYATSWKNMPPGVELTAVTLASVTYNDGLVLARFNGRGAASGHTVFLSQPKYDNLYAIEVLALTGTFKFHRGAFERKPPSDGGLRMKLYPMRRGHRNTSNAGGFTLAEAAVTIAIVALMLIYVLQGLEGAKMAAFLHQATQDRLRARRRFAPGEIKAGLYREELESGDTGDFSDKDEPTFSWEVALGEDALEETDDVERPYDNLAERRSWEQDQEDRSDSDNEDEEEAEVTLREDQGSASYSPPLGDRPNELVIEEWVAWVEIYGEDEDEELSGETSVGGDLGSNGGPGAEGASK